MPLSEKVIDLYRNHGLDWAVLRAHAPVHEQQWVDRFRALLAPGSTILDLGCGTGQPLATGLVARGFHITGVDTAPSMLAIARAAMPEQEWLEQDMRRISLGRRFGGVIAWDSFFHLSHDDQAAMFPRFRDHALPDAPLLFTTGPDHGESVGELAGEPLYHASLAPRAYRALLASYGFVVVDHRANDPDAGGRTVWLATRDKRHAMNREQRIEAVLRAALNPADLSVIDESDQHAGHSGARPGGETHYRVIIKSTAFAGKTRVDRHRMVNALMKEEFESGLHALALVTKAPGE